MLQIGRRGRWKSISIFQTNHILLKKYAPKSFDFLKKNPICQIFHQKKIKKVLMKIEEMVDVFLNLANFVQRALLTLAPPRGYTLNL